MDEWQCRASGRTYPACLGIPDFRRNGGAQPAEVRTLVDAFDTSSFDELVRLRTRPTLRPRTRDCALTSPTTASE